MKRSFFLIIVAAFSLMPSFAFGGGLRSQKDLELIRYRQKLREDREVYRPAVLRDMDRALSNLKNSRGEGSLVERLARLTIGNYFSEKSEVAFEILAEKIVESLERTKLEKIRLQISEIAGGGTYRSAADFQLATSDEEFQCFLEEALGLANLIALDQPGDSITARRVSRILGLLLPHAVVWALAAPFPDAVKVPVILSALAAVFQGILTQGGREGLFVEPYHDRLQERVKLVRRKEALLRFTQILGEKLGLPVSGKMKRRLLKGDAQAAGDILCEALLTPPKIKIRVLEPAIDSKQIEEFEELEAHHERPKLKGLL